MAELPDDIVEQVRDELGMVLSVGSVRVLRAAYPLIAARVRAEAVADERQRIEQLEQLATDNARLIRGLTKECRDLAAEVIAALSSEQHHKRMVAGLPFCACGLSLGGGDATGSLITHLLTLAAGSVPVAGEPEIVAWAVRAADGMVYVPGDSPIQAGTKKQAERVAARNQGKGGVWSVVPLVAGSVPVATPDPAGRDGCPTCGVSAPQFQAFDDDPCRDEFHSSAGPVATPTEPADPTYGRIDPDIQRAVDEMEPESVGSRVAMENTLQARRDAATPTEPAGRHVCTDNPCHARHHAGYGQLCTVVGCTEDWCKGSHQGAASSAGRVALSSSHEPLPGRRT